MRRSGSPERRVGADVWPRGVARSMLSGFNTNFRHRGVLFHVQTEDSGLANPHVTTHLFHGGNILASERRDYADRVAAESGEALQSSVRRLMEGLHKSMLKGLARGEYDAAIEQRMGPDVFPVAAEPTPMTPITRERAAGRSFDPLEPAGAGSFDPREPIGAASPIPSRTPAVFGAGLLSHDRLDEVMLDYLVEKACERHDP